MNLKDSDAAIIYWPGSSVRMNFEGTEVKALIRDEKGNNYFYIVVDSSPVTKFRPDSTKQLYTLVSHLAPGRHSMQLYKLTEGTMGKTWFYGFELNAGGKILPPPPLRKRKIEFYGNSVTTGYTLEDTVDDSRLPVFYNNYLAYPSLTARHYNADFHCISKSGIGIMLSWFPIIMPEMYDRLDPDDSVHKWDFTTYKPDIVVINLLENDSWLVLKPDFHQFIARFGTKAPTEEFIINAYKNFVQTIRGKYPDASIICALGNMDIMKPGSPWPGYVIKAVAQLNDPKIYTHFFPYHGRSDRHPKAREHEEIANSLIKFIDDNIKW